MNDWPDSSFALLKRHVGQLGLCGPKSCRPRASILRCFQRFVMGQAARPALSRPVIESWLRAVDAVAPRSMLIRRAQIVDRFLDWLVAHQHLDINPFAVLRAHCAPRGTRSIVPALLSPDPETALERLRRPPRFGSRFGPVLHDHVGRMRALGYKCEEGRFLRFDRFLQRCSSAESLPALIQAYVAEGPTPSRQIERLTVGRILVRELQRGDPSVPDPPALDRLIRRAVLRERCRPHIYSAEEIGRLLSTAREFPSPKAPLRPLTLYTMLVLAYCVGLRIGEIVRLELRDVQLDEGVLEIRETKFFKSRRLPIRSSVAAVLGQYLAKRAKYGLSDVPEAPLFCHERGGYAYFTAEQLLFRIIRAAGLKPAPGRRGPRVHDLRHTFVVHRMLAWYRQGINPQAKLPYLSTYLGHRDIHSTIVYLTITKELLGLANERFRTLGASLLAAPQGDDHVHDSVPSAPPAGVLSPLVGPTTWRLRPHRSRLPRHVATVPPVRGRSSAPRRV
uniref:Integrase n=1 Tax=Eiseniibacteriota bacterium TaxID=2212470 RepID=A0A832I4T0_UNCEI